MIAVLIARLNLRQGDQTSLADDESLTSGLWAESKAILSYTETKQE